MDIFKLESSSLCLPPNVIRFCVNMWRTGSKDEAVELLSMWADDKRVHDAVFAGNYLIEGGDVIVPIPVACDELIASLGGILSAIDQDIYMDIPASCDPEDPDDATWAKRLEEKDAAIQNLSDLLSHLEQVKKAEEANPIG